MIWPKHGKSNEHKEASGKFDKMQKTLLTQKLVINGLGFGQARFKIVLKEADAFGVSVGLCLCRLKGLLQLLIFLEESNVFIAEILDITSLRKSPLRLSKSIC